MTAKKSKRISWTKEEDILMLDLKNEGKKSKQIAKSLKKEFGNTRSSAAIDSRYHMLSHRKDEKNTPTSILEPEKCTQIYERLKQYDEERLVGVLKGRDELIYKLMSEQADRIRNFDILSQYKGIGLVDAMQLDTEDRVELANILMQEEKSVELDNIEIVSVPGYGKKKNEVSFVLPLYLEDVRNSSGSFRSHLHDIIVGCISRKNSGFITPRNKLFRDRFKDLIMYNTHSDASNYEELRGEITNVLSKEDSSISVSIFEVYPSINNGIGE